jgi:hypothetical protein
MEAPMADPLDHSEVTGTISTPRHAGVRYRAGHECGDLFTEGDEFDGFTLTIEVSGLDDAMAMVEAIRADLPPDWLTNCCKCGRVVDTRENDQGGDAHGCELPDSRWVCSSECYSAALLLPDLPPTPEQIASDPRVQALVEASTHALPAVRGLIEAAQKYGVFDNLLPELFPDSTRRGVKRADGFANVMSAQANAQAWLDCLEIALAAFRAEGGAE